MMPLKPPNTFFVIRIEGKIMKIAFNSLADAERAAHGPVAAGRSVEIVDGVTWEIIKRLR